MQNTRDSENPPIFNLPPVIVFLTVSMVGVHIIRIWLIPAGYENDFILLLAAIPARYGEYANQIPYAFAAWYTPFSYALVHADWSHLMMNMLWMLALGSPIAKRWGAGKFLVFACLGAMCGFLAHLITHINDFSPMVGASGAVSAFAGGVIRLDRNVKNPILPLSASLQNRGLIAFIVVWLVINLIVGLMPGLIAQEGTQIAWQAHIGGFFCGLFLIKWLDSWSINISAKPQP